MLHADIANIKILAQFVVDPIYYLVFDDLFTSKTYTYPAIKKKSFSKKMEEFYNDINKKTVLNKTMRLQLITIEKQNIEDKSFSEVSDVELKKMCKEESKLILMLK